MQIGQYCHYRSQKYQLDYVLMLAKCHGYNFSQIEIQGYVLSEKCRTYLPVGAFAELPLDFEAI